MKTSRRKFIRDAGIITSGITLAANNSMASVLSSQLKSENTDIVINIFQRGAADGLHSVVPYGDSEYFNLRPQTAVNNSIDLNGFFGLNPDLSALKTIWDAGDLGIIHAAGSPSDSRSHFDSQDNMEYANLDKGALRVGWLAQYLSITATSDDSVFRAIALNDSIQKSIKGEVEALTITNLTGFDVKTHANLYDDSRDSIENIFQNGEHFNDTASVLFSAIDILKQINPEDYPVDNGAIYPNDRFANKLRTLGIIIKAGLGTQIACLDIGGWDNHNDILTNYPIAAQSFSEGLLAFYQDMGDRMENITILCTTEFGRRAAENASIGTDHGHGGVIYAIGKQVNGGEIYGDWPGLLQHNLFDGDLEVTTDFREVFSELLRKRLKYTGNLLDVIPDYSYGGGIGIFKN